MSNSSAANEPKRYFHASPAVFESGTVLVPPTVSGVTPNYSVGRPTTRVFMSDEVALAEEWAMHLKHLSRHSASKPEVHVYEVRPMGRIYSAYLNDMEIVEFHAATAVVVARVGSTTTFARS
jgi:hypothetical protein